MKRALAAALAISATFEAAFAQSPPMQTAREVRAQCRVDAIAQGIRGSSRRAYVEQCIERLRPDIARADYCRMLGKYKGLDGTALKGYVKACKSGV